MSQNGGYINPPRIKRQHRDPYGVYWDQQERRNFGEPVHEDNDMLGMFSTYDYTWTTTGKGLVMMGSFIAVFLGVSGLVYLKYPDVPSYPREFEGGLERELGGPGAVRVSCGRRLGHIAMLTRAAGTDGRRRRPLRNQNDPSHLYINHGGALEAIDRLWRSNGYWAKSCRAVLANPEQCGKWWQRSHDMPSILPASLLYFNITHQLEISSADARLSSSAGSGHE